MADQNSSAIRSGASHPDPESWPSATASVGSLVVSFSVAFRGSAVSRRSFLIRSGIFTLFVALLVTAAVMSYRSNMPDSTGSAAAAPAVISTSSLVSRPAVRTTSQPNWGGNGVFSVGQPAGGQKTIAPGRYTVEMADPKLDVLVIMRCSGIPCTESENFIAGDSGFGAGFSTVIEILPTDVAVRLVNARLIPIG
ncbi:hypothetical protein ACFVMC_00235 [Nocardia sp. NPDC127579]|uniref:hypothetical protein n=1 Tax=Nocardia sp. NPDC127579 TaxID=3345402 RepID=UPI0036365223